MLQRLIAALLGVLGIAAAALGIASATAWRADDPLVATVTASSDDRTLVTDPGVLELAGDPVTVTVTAGDSPVVLVVGRDTDVDAWIGTDAYLRVTGLSGWHTLATSTGEPPAGVEPSAAPSTEAAAPEVSATEPAADPSASATAGTEAPAAAVTAADPTGSDLWIVQTTGDGTASLEWSGADHAGRWSLMAVSLGDTSPTLALSWPQTVTTPWLWPGVAVGVLLVAIALVLGVRLWRRARLGPDADWHDVSTGMITVVPRPDAVGAGTGGTAAAPPTAAPAGPGSSPVGAVPLGTVSAPEPTPGQPLTRRQIREAEAAAAASRGRGRRPATGTIPTVAGPATAATPVVEPAPGALPAPADAAATPVAGRAATAAGATTSGAGRGEASTAPATSPVPSPGSASGAGSTVSGAAAPASGPGLPGAAGPAGAATSAAGPTPPAPSPGSTYPSSVSGPAARAAATGAQPTVAPAAPSVPATPTTTDDGSGQPAPAADGPRRRRGLSGLLGRRDRGAPAVEDTSGTPTAPAATSWNPVPGTVSSRPASAGTGRPTAPAPAAPSTPPVPAGGVETAEPEDDSVSHAQRADAWRRMWGFPADGPGESGPQDQEEPPAAGAPRPTEEDR
ncbi:MAG TPA: hypothetical protein VGC57_12130 [Cellulomonas sp.]